MNKFIFDVDGTLTPSRRNIDAEFSFFFLDFCAGNKVYLVTGSDYAKTLEQLGPDICDEVEKIYNCSGNDVWEKGVNTKTSDWILPADCEKYLQDRMQISQFPLRTGNHFEQRPGTLNFSVVGRNADIRQRKEYIRHDLANRERESIALEFNMQFGDKIMAKIGGETGIDIYPVGCDKSQIIKDFEASDTLYFFGDRMEDGGNDLPLAKVIKKGKSFHVKDWRHTWSILQDLQDQEIAN